MPSEEPSKRLPGIGGLLGWLVVRGWPLILLFWLVAAVSSRLWAPSWNSLAYDGDFEYLPEAMPSNRGTRLLNESFPAERARSQLIILLARSGENSGRNAGSLIDRTDSVAGLDLTRRLYHRLAEASVARAVRLGWDGLSEPETPEIRQWIDRALLALEESINADETYYKYFADRLDEITGPLGELTASWPRMSIAYWDRAYLNRVLGEMETVEQDANSAIQLYPPITSTAPIHEREIGGWGSLLDVLTWNDPVIGHRLSPRNARLIVLSLSSEFAAVGNIETLNQVEQSIDLVLRRNQGFLEPGLEIVPTGTAAIGGETLRASGDAIRYTELLTVVLILIILALIYRSPLLVAIPLVSIVTAVICATGLVAVIADAPWIDLKIFTTSRIFVVVILFGAGTDYCLFLIARLREEAALRQSPDKALLRRQWHDAVYASLTGVSSALIGSAMTTVVGLAMLWVADFGKFHYSGPVIAICLLVALAVCTTLTPALLVALGPRVFWPGRIPSQTTELRSPVWHWIAGITTRRPVAVLVIGLGLLVPPAVYGVIQEGRVTYDISSGLGPASVSRKGVELLRQNLSLGETNPITLLLVRKEPAERERLEGEVRELASSLYEIKGVTAVRHASDPLGDYQPGTRTGLFDRTAWRRLALQSHRVSQQFFYSDEEGFRDRLVRLDVIIAGDPFGLEAAGQLKQIRAFIDGQIGAADSIWLADRYAIVGTVPAIADLRAVTASDTVRIKFWVVVAVFIVLVLVLRKIVLSLYMIVTVLISYYATLGVSVLFFSMVYGDTYVGLDWKVPIFLFVILVAVGQDYNVYLVTRILEERKHSHPLAAVRRAVARTGSIITSCGVVMAGTFFSMTASAWVPGLLATFGWNTDGTTATLRGITELGFALGFGVLLDTFYVRTVLVPAFCVLGSKLTDNSSTESTG